MKVLNMYKADLILENLWQEKMRFGKHREVVGKVLVSPKKSKKQAFQDAG